MTILSRDISGLISNFNSFIKEVILSVKLFEAVRVGRVYFVGYS